MSLLKQTRKISGFTIGSMMIGLVIFAIGAIISLNIINQATKAGKRSEISASLDFSHTAALTEIQGSDLRADFSTFRATNPALDACLKGTGTACDTSFNDWEPYTGTPVANQINGRAGLKSDSCNDTSGDCILRRQLQFRLNCSSSTSCQQVEFNIQSSYTGQLSNVNDATGTRIAPLADRNSKITIPAKMPELQPCPAGQIATGVNHSTGQVVCTAPASCLNGTCNYPNPGGTSCSSGTSQNAIGFNFGTDVNCNRIPTLEVGSQYTLTKDSADQASYCPNDTNQFDDCKNAAPGAVIPLKFDRRHTYQCWKSQVAGQNQSTLAPLSMCGLSVPNDPLLYTAIENQIPHASETCGCCSMLEEIKLSFTGKDQKIDVPDGAKRFEVKLWGAAGGHDGGGMWTLRKGGVGGFTEASINLDSIGNPKELIAVIGARGFMPSVRGHYSGAYGFGGYASWSNGVNWNAGGGGLSGVFDGTDNKASRKTALAIAGGGGAGSAFKNSGTTGNPGNHPSLSGGRTGTMQGWATGTSIDYRGGGGGGYEGGKEMSSGGQTIGKGGSGYVHPQACNSRILYNSKGASNPPEKSDLDYNGLAGQSYPPRPGFGIIRFYSCPCN